MYRVIESCGTCGRRYGRDSNQPQQPCPHCSPKVSKAQPGGTRVPKRKIKRVEYR